MPVPRREEGNGRSTDWVYLSGSFRNRAHTDVHHVPELYLRSGSLSSCLNASYASDATDECIAHRGFSAHPATRRCSFGTDEAPPILSSRNGGTLLHGQPRTTRGRARCGVRGRPSHRGYQPRRRHRACSRPSGVACIARTSISTFPTRRSWGRALPSSQT